MRLGARGQAPGFFSHFGGGHCGRGLLRMSADREKDHSDDGFRAVCTKMFRNKSSDRAAIFFPKVFRKYEVESATLESTVAFMQLCFKDVAKEVRPLLRCQDICDTISLKVRLLLLDLIRCAASSC